MEEKDKKEQAHHQKIMKNSAITSMRKKGFKIR